MSSISSLPTSLSTDTQTGLLHAPTSQPDLAISGLASGMNWQSIVQELATAERAPETQWQQEEGTLNTQNTAFQSIGSDLATLQTDLETLQSSSLYTSCTVSTSDSSVSASATNGANLGTYTFDVSSLATASQINGATGINGPLCADGDLGNVTIGTAGFSSPITAGIFTINGEQVTLSTTDSLQDVFNAISTATDGAVTASYDSTPGDANFDKITLTDNEGEDIELGSAADTSNFLQVAQLFNSATLGTSVTSSSKLGSVQINSAMVDSDLKTTITNGAGNSGDGEFMINGVTISYDANSDSIQDVLDDINNSTAGVTATFDSVTNQFIVTNNTTGNVGISMKDVQGNFLAATGLSSGQFVAGNNLEYTLDGGSQQLTSLSNTISSESSGINGLSVTPTQTGTFSVTVSTDTSQIASAVQQFVNDYNTVQTFIASQQAVTDNSDGTVTAGLLTGDTTTSDITQSLRQITFAGITVSSNAGISSLADLGVATNGQDATATLTTSTLDELLNTNPNAVEAFFTTPTLGLCAQLTDYLNDTIGSTNSTDIGTLTQHEQSLTTQIGDIQTQISNLESQITQNTAQWDSEFEAMEQAEATANSELTYLSESVSSGSI